MILISDKIDFKSKTSKRDKERHYMITKGSIHQKDITIVKIHALNIGALKYKANANRTEGRNK